VTGSPVECPRIPAAPFMEWLEQRIRLHKRRIDSYHKWLPTAPPEHGHVQAVCLEIGWFPNSDSSRGWDRPCRRLYRFRKGLSDTKRRGVQMTVLVDTFRRYQVEDALHFAGVDVRRLYERYAARLEGEHATAREVLRFIDIWSPLVELWAADDEPLEADVWCSECGELVTPIRGHCPWHVRYGQAQAA
jgi:hypothetical protein